MSIVKKDSEQEELKAELINIDLIPLNTIIIQKVSLETRANLFILIKKEKYKSSLHNTSL